MRRCPRFAARPTCCASGSRSFCRQATMRAPGGLTCFLAPRWTPEGKRNRILIQRLKDKLGNRSNASAEIEYDASFAWRVGEEGEGLGIIMEMVHHTRLAAATVSAGMMRLATALAIHHAAHRRAFGRRLVE